MSNWEEGAPFWAPTRGEVHTWDTRPQGVSRGRGFEPAGRGRGIAKWTSQVEYGHAGHVGQAAGGHSGHNGHSQQRSSSLDRHNKPRRDKAGPYRYETGGGESRGKEDRFRENGRDKQEKNLVNDSHSSQNQRHSGLVRSRTTASDMRNNGGADYGRHQTTPPGTHGSRSSGLHNGHQRSQVSRQQRTPPSSNGSGGGRTNSSGNGPSRSQVMAETECYKCSGFGHIARKCHVDLDDGSSHGGDIGGGSSVGGGGGGGSSSNYVPGAEEPEEDLFQHGVSSGINFSSYANIDVKISGGEVVDKIDSFNDAHLHSVVLENIRRSNYTMPTPVQKHAIPNILAQRDMMACAQTGSGKTAAFLIPVINRLLEDRTKAERVKVAQAPQAIVISPTRELAIQIKDEARRFSAGSKLRAVVVYGGTSIGHQASQVKDGCNILIATPGRLLDFVDRDIISLRAVKYLVLDEADRMLDMGFKDDINRLVRNPSMPGKKHRTTLLFSATFPDDIQRMASEFLNEYLFLTVGLVGGACKDVTQTFHQVSQYEKREKLLQVMENIYKTASQSYKSLVFVEMKKTADFIASYLCQSGLPTTSIHGDRLQKEREEALEDLKFGRKPILVATAVAARGLDIKNVELVVNYDLPKTIYEYVHRIGRTGRLGNTGRAISFYDSGADSALAADLVRILSDAQQGVPGWLVREAQLNPLALSGTTAAASSGRNFGGKDVRANPLAARDTSWS